MARIMLPEVYRLGGDVSPSLMEKGPAVTLVPLRAVLRKAGISASSPSPPVSPPSPDLLLPVFEAGPPAPAACVPPPAEADADPSDPSPPGDVSEEELSG